MSTEFGSALFWLGANIDDFLKGLNTARRELKKTGRDLKKHGQELSLKLTAPLALAGAAAIKSAGDIETIEIAFEGMLKSGKKAKGLVKELTDFTARTPFQLEGVSGAARQLLAVGVGAEQVQDKLLILGNIASGANVPLNDMASIYGKVQSKGKAFTEELLQMADRGVPIIQVLAETMGVAKEEVFKMASESKITAEVFNDALRSMATGSGIFAGQMERKSTSIFGLISTLKDNLTLSLAELGTDLVETFDLKGKMSTLITGIQEAVKWWKALDDRTKTLIFTFGAFAAALGPVLVAVGTLLTIVGSITAPMLAAAAAISGVIAAVAYLNTSASDSDRILQGLNKTVNKESDSLNALFEALKRTNPESEERKTLIEQINSKYGAYLDNQLSEKDNLGKIEEAQRKANERLRANVALKAKAAASTDIIAKSIEKERKSVEALTGSIKQGNASSLGSELGSFVNQNESGLSRFFSGQKETDRLAGSKSSGVGTMAQDWNKSSEFSSRFQAIADRFGLTQEEVEKGVKEIIEAREEARKSLERLESSYSSFMKGEGLSSPTTNPNPTPTTPTETEEIDGKEFVNPDEIAQIKSELLKEFEDFDTVFKTLNGGTETLASQIEYLQGVQGNLESGIRSLIEAGADLNDSVLVRLVEQYGKVGEAIDKLTNKQDSFKNFIGLGDEIGRAFGQGALTAQNALGKLTKTFVSAMLAQAQALIIKNAAALGVFGAPLAVAGIGAISGLFNNIPQLAEGGLATGPTLAQIGERPSSRGEIVLPLEKAGPMLDKYGGGKNINVNLLQREIELNGDSLRILFDLVQQSNSRIR